MANAKLLDERSDPDFRTLYGRLARRALELDAAVGRVRLGGMDLGGEELGGLHRIRLCVGRMNALALATEAQALAADPERSPRIRLLASLLRQQRLEVRIAPLAGWSPDFSCFRGIGRARSGHPRDGGGPTEGSAADREAVLMGPHWFERPYPHPGPALGVLLHGPPARRAARRFEALWAGAHDLGSAVGSVLHDALRKSAKGAERAAEDAAAGTAPARRMLR